MDSDSAVFPEVGWGYALLRLGLAGGIEQGHQPAGVAAVEQPFDVAFHFQRHQAARQVREELSQDRQSSAIDAKAARHGQEKQTTLAAVERGTEDLAGCRCCQRLAACYGT